MDEVACEVGAWGEADGVLSGGGDVFVCEFAGEGVLVGERDGEAGLDEAVSVTGVVGAEDGAEGLGDPDHLLESVGDAGRGTKQLADEVAVKLNLVGAWTKLTGSG